jgi:hypothetical protein
MSKFNTPTSARPRVSGPITTNPTPTGRTFNGAPGFERDAKGELFLLAVANMVGENTFYEAASDRDLRFQELVRKVAVEDADWFTRFVAWLRGPEANMRSASMVAAAEGVKARLDAKIPGNRQIISAALQRADEPGELVAYWISKHGRDIPKPVKRGINDAVQRLYNEYGTLKYDTQSSGIRFADVIALTHPTPVAPWQDELFSFINARRWNRLDEHRIGDSLTMIEARKLADAKSRDELLADPDLMRAAGYTWENIAGKGAMDARAWEAVIPNMGYMALLRNLRNFDQAGISKETREVVRAKLKDPEQVARSRQFPFRFLSAYQATRSENWSRELEEALTLSLANVPALKGKTLILVDRSGSMFSSAGGGLSDMTRADVAALFGVAIGARAEYADVVEFGSSGRSSKIDVRKGDSVLKSIQKFGNLGGTDTQAALIKHYRPGFHTRIMLVTDEQATGFWSGSRYVEQAVGHGVSDDVPIYTWNLAGYRMGSVAGGKNRFTFGGLTDAAFRMVPLLEAGKNADWPF